MMNKIVTYLRFMYYDWVGKRNPKRLCEIRFREFFERDINWEYPQDINEKINWLKFNSDTSEWSRLADKYAVREYVIGKGYGENLAKLYGKWDDACQIDWDSLPSQFVLKLNNGSGDAIICKDKNKIDRRHIADYFNHKIKKGFGYVSAEPHYLAITPCIIAEELLDVTKQQIKTSSLIDYKIWCFNGKPDCIWACYDRNKESVKVAIYDLDWKCHPEYSVYTSYYQKADKLIPRPKSLDRMVRMAASLSEGFPQVRVDLYEVDNKPYFGEMTFTSSMGYMDFYTPEFLLYLGSKFEVK